MLAALASPAAYGAHPGHFDVTRDGRAYRIDASADLVADPALAWSTLTDYGNLPRFVPGVIAVRVLEAHEEGGRQRLLVEQRGEIRFLFFSRRIVVLLDVQQDPRTRVNARALPRPPDPAADAANVDDFEGTYTLQPIPGGVRLGYRAHFAPGFALPPVLGPLAVRLTLQTQFEAMLAEIDRRRLVAPLPGPTR